MEEKMRVGKQSSLNDKAPDKLNIGFFGNKLFIRSVNVGSNFDNIFFDLMIINH